MIDEEQNPDLEGFDPSEMVIEVEITDTLDLHSFRPRDQKDVLLGYLDAAIEEGYTDVRIIHGRGIGVQRKMVQRVLSRDPRVVEFSDAPPDGGGWGATLVRLSGRVEPESSD